MDLFEQAGHEVIEAGNADEAIRILESRSDISVVFSDLQMPGSMDGLRLLELIRNRWPPIKLILTSGNDLASDDGLPGGAVFVRKPFDHAAVANALAMV